MREAVSALLASYEHADECHTTIAQQCADDAAKLFRSAGFRQIPEEIVRLTRHEHKLIRLVYVLTARVECAEERGEHDAADLLARARTVNGNLWERASARLYAKLDTLAT